jgi:hypothetical protein
MSGTVTICFYDLDFYYAAGTSSHVLAASCHNLPHNVELVSAPFLWTSVTLCTTLYSSTANYRSISQTLLHLGDFDFFLPVEA